MKRFLALCLFTIMVISLVSCGSGGDMSAPSLNDVTNNKKDPTLTTPPSGTDKPEQTTENNITQEPPVDSKKVIKFVAAGDALIHSAIYREAEKIASDMKDYSGDYYFKNMYQGIASLIKSADIAFVNHEAPIANTGISGYPNFNAPSESGDALVDIGFNVVNIANNHMYDVDHKATGYSDTIDYWKSKDVLMIGGYENQEDYDTPRILNVEGVNIAFLSYTDFVNPPCKMNSKSVNKGYISPIAKDSVMIKHIEKAKEKADLVFVSIHWGAENVFTASAEQKRVAKLLADNGVDVIIGHHSHTVQPVEWIKGKNGNNTLCIYSLGNLISGMLSSKNMVGGLMTFDIVKENGEISIENPIYEPIVCHYEIDDFSKKDPEGNPVRTNFQVYLMKDYTEALTKKHGTQKYGSYGLNTLQNYVKNTVSSSFLPDYLK